MIDRNPPQVTLRVGDQHLSTGAAIITATSARCRARRRLGAAGRRCGGQPGGAGRAFCLRGLAPERDSRGVPSARSPVPRSSVGRPIVRTCAVAVEHLRVPHCVNHNGVAIVVGVRGVEDIARFRRLAIEQLSGRVR